MNSMYAVVLVGVIASLLTGVTLFHNSLAVTSNTTNTTTGTTTKVPAALSGQNQQEGNEQVDANLTRQSHIAPDQAITAATKNMSVQASDVRSVKLDNENGQLVFSVDITKANSQPVDVKVDAINGKVLRVDQGIDEEQNDESGQSELGS